MADVRFNAVSKVYPDGTQAVSKLDLEVRDGELMVLVGPSGSGKTTALRMVAGLEEISTGTIEIGGRVVNRVPPRDRDIAMVFQNYALYPHMKAFDNIGFGLRLRKRPKEEIREKVDSASKLLGLDDILSKKPRELSGGQRQRVASGRAIVREPQVFLMDEPLSNLDAQLRVHMRAEIRQLQTQLGVTMLYVTHDQVEAMTLGDRVAVFREGVLQQVDAPEELYDRPANIFVASFIGSPAMNFLWGVLKAEKLGVVLQLGDASVSLREDVAADRGLAQQTGKSVIVGIRPERLLGGPGGSEGTLVHGRVELVEPLGAESLVHLSVPIRPALEMQKIIPEVRQNRSDRASVIGRLESGRHLRLNDEIELLIQLKDLHFFDSETGVSIGQRADGENFSETDVRTTTAP